MECRAELYTTEIPGTTWFNQHPELERIIEKGIEETKHIFHAELNGTVDVERFCFKKSVNRRTTRELNCSAGHMGNFTTIARAAPFFANITYIDDNTRIVTFFIKVGELEVFYPQYNQSYFNNFYDEGKMLVRLGNNYVTVNCTVRHDTGSRWRARITNVSCEFREEFLVRAIHSYLSGRTTWVDQEDVKEFEKQMREVYSKRILSPLNETLDKGFNKSGITEFFNDFFEARKFSSTLLGFVYKI